VPTPGLQVFGPRGVQGAQNQGEMAVGQQPGQANLPSARQQPGLPPIPGHQRTSNHAAKLAEANNVEHPGHEVTERSNFDGPEADPGQRLIEKVYVRDQDGNTVELRTFLCPDGSTKTERRIAINARGELHGKFKETGVDLNDVMQIDQNEIDKLIHDNAIKSAQKHHGGLVTPLKNAPEEQKSQKTSGDKQANSSPMQPFQFSTFQQHNQLKMSPEHAQPEPKQVPEQQYYSEEKENVNRMEPQQPAHSSPLAPKNQNQPERSQPEPAQTKYSPNVEQSSGKKVVSSKEQATLKMPPSLASSIKGKAIKVRYKDCNGKTYPVGVSGPDLTKTEKEWLLRKIIEKEGLTVEEVEAIEGGHLTDVDDGSEYRLTSDKENLQGEYSSQSDSHYKNQRGSNLVKDIQNQVINEQDEEIVSHSSAYPSQRMVPGQQDMNAPVQKFDLMHRPPDSVNSRNDEIWFRTKEQKVIEDGDQYRHYDMSKSSNKSPLMINRQESSIVQMSNRQGKGEIDYESAEKDIYTKFNYGTGQQYNPGFSPKYETGSGKKGGSGYKEAEEEAQYDPSDIDALLRHNENLLSKIKFDMKNIGESFVSHTDMGSSRVGIKNNLSGMYNQRNPEFDSKDMINRSPIGIQEFESFKTKTNEVIPSSF
jgi:hypothetical protein